MILLNNRFSPNKYLSGPPNSMNDANKIASGFDFLSILWPSLSNQMAGGSDLTGTSGSGGGGGSSFAEICGSRNSLVWTCAFFWLLYSGFGCALKVGILFKLFLLNENITENSRPFYGDTMSSITLTPQRFASPGTAASTQPQSSACRFTSICFWPPQSGGTAAHYSPNTRAP